MPSVPHAEKFSAPSSGQAEILSSAWQTGENSAVPLEPLAEKNSVPSGQSKILVEFCDFSEASPAPRAEKKSVPFGQPGTSNEYPEVVLQFPVIFAVPSDAPAANFSAPSGHTEIFTMPLEPPAEKIWCLQTNLKLLHCHVLWCLRDRTRKCL